MLYLTKQQLDNLVEHSKSGSPDEVCGLLAGRDGNVEKVYRMTNTGKSSTSFFMDPKEQLKVFKEMRHLEIEMLGIYHSHPETSAYPSQRDCEMAFYPEASYIVISLQDFNNPDVRAFKIIEGKIEEEEIVIKEE